MRRSRFRLRVPFFCRSPAEARRLLPGRRERRFFSAARWRPMSTIPRTILSRSPHWRRSSPASKRSRWSHTIRSAWRRRNGSGGGVHCCCGALLRAKPPKPGVRPSGRRRGNGSSSPERGDSTAEDEEDRAGDAERRVEVVPGERLFHIEQSKGHKYAE